MAVLSPAIFRQRGTAEEETKEVGPLGFAKKGGILKRNALADSGRERNNLFVLKGHWNFFGLANFLVQRYSSLSGKARVRRSHTHISCSHLFCLQLWEESQKQNSRLREDNDRMRDDLAHARRQLENSKVSDEDKNSLIIKRFKGNKGPEGEESCKEGDSFLVIQKILQYTRGTFWDCSTICTAMSAATRMFLATPYFPAMQQNLAICS